MILQVKKKSIYIFFFITEPAEHCTLNQQIMIAMSGSCTVFLELCAASPYGLSFTKLVEEFMNYKRAE